MAKIRGRILAADTLVDANGTNLTAHKPTGPFPGAYWFVQSGMPASPASLKIQANGAVADVSTAAQERVAFVGAVGPNSTNIFVLGNDPVIVPWPNDISVSFNLHVITVAGGASAQGVVLRADISNGTTEAALAWYTSGSNPPAWNIGYNTAFGGTSLNSVASYQAPLPAGGTDNMIFEVEGSTYRLYRNGSLILSDTGTISTQVANRAGNPGVFNQIGTGTNTTGVHLETIMVYELVTPVHSPCPVYLRVGEV